MTCSEFIFRMPTGEEVGRVKNQTEMSRAIKNMPIESVTYHHINKHFTPWLSAHGFDKRAKEMEHITSEGEELRKRLVKMFERKSK